MPMINFTNPITLLIVTLLFVLALILSKETKKSAITAVFLFIFVGLLVAHTILLTTGDNITEEIRSDLIFTMVLDLVFILISFIGYLWIDDIEAIYKKKKSIDNSLDWFWQKI